MRIHLDQPAGVIDTSFFHLRGWVAGEGPIAEIETDINGQRVPVFRHVRPDVARAFPDCHTSGFSTFVRLSQIPCADKVEIRILSGGANYAREVALSPSALESIPRDEEARREKRAWILSRVVCLLCGGELNGAARCLSCGHAYGTREAAALNFIPPSHAAEPFGGAVCSHGYDGDVERIVGRVENAGGKVLDCGAGLRPTVRRAVVTTEIFENPSTDVLALNERLPFKDNVFDAVLSLHVLEHVPDPFACARELERVLKPGGTLYAVTPMIVPGHGYPYHFFNPTREGLARLFHTSAAEARIFIPAIGHPINGVHSVLNLYHLSLPAPQREKFLSMTVRDLLSESIEHWIAQDIATAMYEEDRAILAANFAIELVKR